MAKPKNEWVSAKHRDYEAMAPRWKKIRDCAAGSNAIKGAREEYLPRLDGQTKPEYDSYLARALFMEATKRTLQAIVGLVFRKRPDINARDEVKERFLSRFSANNNDIVSFARRCIKEVFVAYRFGVFVDIRDGNGEPYVVGYAAEDIINWDFDQSEDGRDELVLVVLREVFEKPHAENPFKKERQEKYRELVLESVEGGKPIFVSRLWYQDEKSSEWVKEEEIAPEVRGKTLDYIPFKFITADGEDDNLDAPYLEPISEVNLSHYLNSADLEHGRHFTALPTAWAAGFKMREGDKLRIGSTVAWVSEDPQAKADFLEFTGQGLGALEKGIEQKQGMMVILGAQMLEEPKKVAESAESRKVRGVGDQSIVASVAESVDSGLNTVLKWISDIDPTLGSMTIELNKKYTHEEMSPQLLKELTSSLVTGAMSFDVFYYNMERAGAYPIDHDLETERAKISLDDGDLGPRPGPEDRGE